MKIACVGGGPGGLYAALLLARTGRHEVTVFDRNPPDATYGWGVVFSDETLGFLEEADPETYGEIARSFVHWECIDIHDRGRVIRSGGHAFSGVARARLLGILQARCAELGVNLRFQHEVSSVDELDEYDLIVASDGVNSPIRHTYRDIFCPTVDRHGTRYIWLGARLHLDAFTFIFRRTEWGMFQVHAYPFSPDISTFIVECNGDVWERAGLAVADEEQSIAFCAQLFAPELNGAELLSNRSSWLTFLTLRNATWHYRNIALLGDAAHTAHFSVGSGTKMAMEDAIALAAALEKRDTLDAALVEYEEIRMPSVERTQAAARESSLWFEHVPRYARFAPEQFAFSLLTRSKRVTYDNLKTRDPSFSLAIDDWFNRQAGNGAVFPPPPPSLTPLRLGDLTIPNRLVERPTGADTAEDGVPGDRHLIEMGSATLTGAGLVITEPLAVVPEGRITSRSAGLYGSHHLEAWTRIVDSVHALAGRVGALLSHAGRRGATRPRREGTDLPLADPWPLLAPSPLRYAPWSQLPQEIGQAQMACLRQAFMEAAQRACDAGFDLLELDAGEGYLLSSFLSPLANRRTDEYGGSTEARLRFPLEVWDAIRSVWPESKPLAVRLTVAEWAAGGMGEEEALSYARAFKERGADLIEVVTGGTVVNANPTFGRTWQVPFSDLIRNEAQVPALAAGSIAQTDDVNTVLAAGRADLCLLDPRPLRDFSSQPATPSATEAPRL